MLNPAILVLDRYYKDQVGIELGKIGQIKSKRRKF